MQLKKSVLASVQLYWSSIFIIQKTVLKKIESVLAAFLWTGGDSNRYKAKVAWKEVCKPVEAGGLGVKDLVIWNQALILKLIWNICSKKDSLWIIWIHTY